MILKYFHSALIPTILLSTAASLKAQQTASITLKPTDKTVIISRDIYGQFAEHLGRSIYDGFYRHGKIRTDIVTALRRIRVPNLRWPGGCFADQYHWRDGIGPMGKRPTTINTTWGMVKEDNSFGTHEFLDLCQQIGCEPYIAGNVGTGSPQEMKDWIEYLNLNNGNDVSTRSATDNRTNSTTDKKEKGSSLSALRVANGHPAPYKVALWGVGNESWGCGGNMTPEYYADLYKHYAAFCPDYPGAPLKKVISGANADDYHWTEVMMKNVGPGKAYGLSLHYYTIPSGQWSKKGSATNFSEQEYAHTLKGALFMDELITKNEVIMDRYDSAKKMALLVDEWGVWTDVEPGTPEYAMYQQSSLRDALAAASTLNIFNNHAARVRGANLAQTVNVIHSMILTQGERMLLTPTYHVFDLYQVHQNARLIPLDIASPLYINGSDTVRAVNASASIDSLGRTHVSLVNLDPHQTITVMLPLTGKNITGKIITSANVTDINTFDQPDHIAIKSFTGFSSKANQLQIVLPAKSVVMLQTH